MKRLCSWAVLLLAVVLSRAYAQEYTGKGRLIGYVYDKDGNPLEGVKVKLFCLKVKQGFEVVTDKEGKWMAAWIKGGTWNIDFEKIGYLVKKVSIEVQELQRNPEAKVTLEKAEGFVITDDLKAQLNLGNQLFDEKKYDEAAAVYKSILEKFPDAYIINKNIGNCYFQEEKYDLAEEAYLKILDKDPTNVDAKLLIGNCYANRGQQEKALEWYGKIDFEKLSDPIVLYNIGNDYYNVSKFEDALKYYLKSVEIQKDFADGLYQLGLTYLALGKYPESITTFENYLKVDPDSQRANQAKGFIEFLKKKRDETKTEGI